MNAADDPHGALHETVSVGFLQPSLTRLLDALVGNGTLSQE
jgi:hypothetical protein